MPVTEQTTVNTHNGNGVSTVFAYSFKILDQVDIEVRVDGVVKTLTTDYSVSGVGNDGGGSVTMVTAPASGTENVVLRRAMAYERSNDYQENGDLDAVTLDEDADRPIMLLQQLVADLARSLKLPVGTTETQEITESSVDRAGKVLAFDASGNLIVAVPGDLTITIDPALYRAKADDVILSAGKVVTFEGATDDTFETTLSATDPTADRNITLPNASGMLPLEETLKSTGTMALTADISPTQITADQNDYNPTGLSTSSVLRLSSDAARNITGLQGGGDGRLLVLHNVGSFTITLKSASASSSAANRFALTGDLALAANAVAVLQYDATDSRWRALSASGGATISVSAAVNANTGTSIDFTGLPTGAKRLTGNLVAVSTNGTSLVQSQLGKSGGVETTNYKGCTQLSASRVAHSTGAQLDQVGAAAALRHGTVVWNLQDATNNVWCSSGGVTLDETAGGCTQICGSKALAGTLDRIRFTTVGGTDQFDGAGTINLTVEY